MTPSGTLVLRPAGAAEHPEDPQMPLEESTMPDRHDKNIEKVFPVFGHRFVAKVGRKYSKANIPLSPGLQPVCLLCSGPRFHLGIRKTGLIHCSSILGTIIMPRACLVNNVE